MISDDGRIGLFAVWRAGSSFLTTHDITYFESADNGATWRSITGAALSLPLRPPGTTGDGSAAPIAFPVAQNAGIGLINQAGAVFDEEGHPHTARWLYDLSDKTVYRLHHFWHDGATWQDEVVITTTGPASSTGTIGIARPALIRAAGRVLVLWRDTYQAPQLLNATDVTPGADRMPTFPLATVDLGGYEVNFDYDAIIVQHRHRPRRPSLSVGAPGAVSFSVAVGQIADIARRSSHG